MARFLAVSSLVWLTLAELPHAQTPTPILRSRVDLVLVEAVVLNDAGKPVTSLQAGDIDLRVDGTARPVLWVQPATAAPITPGVAPTAGGAAPADTSERPASAPPLLPRRVVVIVDRNVIAIGGGQAQLDAAAMLIEQLPATDRVALWIMPSAARGLQFSTPRDVLARAVRSAVGLQTPPNTPFVFAPGEALSAVDGDQRIVDDVVRRECLERQLARKIPHCAEAARQELRTVGAEERNRLRVSLDSLEAVAAAVAPLDGPKDLLLVSGVTPAGLEETKRLASIERIANASRISIHVLQTASTLAQLVDASSQTSTIPPSLMLATHDSAPVALAGATGGQAWSGNPRVGVQRLLGEMAGTWILAIEATDEDRGDREHRLDVRAVRKGLNVVRARRGFRVERSRPTSTETQPSTVPADNSAAAPNGESPDEPVAPTRAVAAGDRSDDAVLDAMRAYIVAFEKALSTVVIEERYVQVVKRWAGIPRADRVDPILDFEASPNVPRRGHLPVLTMRRLRSDLLLVQSAEGMWTGYRDAFEVDGHSVRDRSDRLRKLFFEGGAAREPELRRIADESTRYNLGSTIRNVNLPTFPLFYLHPRNAFRLNVIPRGTVDLDGVPARYFEFRERTRNTLVTASDGTGVPIMGRVWVEPVSGAVLRAVVRFEVSGSRRSEIDVRFRRADGLSVLVPDRLWEWYQGGRRSAPANDTFAEREQYTESLATYSHLRRFTVETSETVK